MSSRKTVQPTVKGRLSLPQQSQKSDTQLSEMSLLKQQNVDVAVDQSS
jgi:hypothetical protein